METEVIKVDTRSSPEELLTHDGINKGARFLREGEVIAFPTETVYGLGADALKEEAVEKIFAAKKRPKDNPLIIHIARREDLEDLVEGEIPPAVRDLAARFWPGPLTVILPRSSRVPAITCGGLDTVAVRMPSHPVARALFARAGVAVAAPSANLSGLPSPTRADHVLMDMEGEIPLILDGGETPIGVESTVIDMSSENPRILRPGGVASHQIKEILGEDTVIEREYKVDKKDGVPRSPGMKYRHYAPRSDLELLLNTDPGKLYEYACNRKGYRAILMTESTARAIEEETGEKVFSSPGRGKEEKLKFVLMGRDDQPEDIAHNLFTYLRQLDEEGRELIMVEAIEPEGLGEAIMNRLRRAATDVIDLA